MESMKPPSIRSLTAGVLAAFTLHAAAAEKVDFIKEVKPILEAACVHCHGPEKDEGDFRIDSKKAAFAGNENGPGIVAGDPEKSAVYFTTTYPEDHDLVMPPNKGKQLSKGQQEVLKNWVAQGAEWPDALTLQEVPRMNFRDHIEPLLRRGGPFNAKEKEFLALWVSQGAVWPDGFKLGGEKGPEDDLALVAKIHAHIKTVSTEKTQAEMKEYAAKVPDTGAPYTMVPIPGGEFTMGSPAGELNRRADEGPQHKVKIEPFWMGKFEVTWNEYEPFMITSIARRKDGLPVTVPPDAEPPFIVSKPTSPYVEMSFGMGTTGFPAISMTEHAALKYCEWLSAQTGHFYRLPTEAEWEYACRAGTDTAYSFGNDATLLPDYAWYFANSNGVYQKVGLKKPNPWGLYDMHGNVMEWTMDLYSPTFYAAEAGSVAVAPFNKPGTDLYPRVTRGGSWTDDPVDLRSAARVRSSHTWKRSDPQLPKSIWYHTDAQWLGFRIVRPLAVPDAAKMHEIWNLGRGEENEIRR